MPTRYSCDTTLVSFFSLSAQKGTFKHFSSSLWFHSFLNLSQTLYFSLTLLRKQMRTSSLHHKYKSFDFHNYPFLPWPNLRGVLIIYFRVCPLSSLSFKFLSYPLSVNVHKASILKETNKISTFPWQAFIDSISEVHLPPTLQSGC